MMTKSPESYKVLFAGEIFLKSMENCAGLRRASPDKRSGNQAGQQNSEKLRTEYMSSARGDLFFHEARRAAELFLSRQEENR